MKSDKTHAAIKAALKAEAIRQAIAVEASKEKVAKILRRAAKRGKSD